MVLGMANAANQGPPASQLAKVVQEVREQGCKGRPGATRLTYSDALNVVAQHLEATGNLSQSEREAGYRSVRAHGIRMTGHRSFASIKGVLATAHCDTLIDAQWSEVGISGSLGNVSIVLAKPFVRKIPDVAQVASQILTLVNSARERGATCGSLAMPSVPALLLSTTLTSVAQAHADDMATANYYAHESKNGDTPSRRMQRAGYRATTTGENIAAGQQSAEEVVSSWLESPGHCKNILNSAFTELGVGVALNNSSEKGIYWVQNFGSGER